MNLLATTAAAYWSNKLILRARNKGNRNITVILYYSANYKHHSTVNHHSTDTIPMENVDRVEDLINIQACNFWQKGKDSTGVLGDNMSCVFFYSCRASIIFQWVRQLDSQLKLYPIKQWLSGWTVDSLDDSGKFLHIKPKAWQSSDLQYAKYTDTKKKNRYKPTMIRQFLYFIVFFIMFLRKAW